MTAADHAHLDVPFSYGYSPDMIKRFAPVGVDRPYPICAAYRSNHAVWLPSLATDEYPDLTGIFRENQSYALAALPLVIDGRAVGAAGWTFRTPRMFSNEEREAFVDIASFVSTELSASLA